ncbi:hypothetical protein Leryth_022062 [Lithospermum erythrorhizon]|uniref:LysM domain-containing protein n=1 Tax=Lithospermum erythrorhizon TaxID=34254 RepID=A0AAV3NMW8_LITER|nr:hypothetical protein Leryth_022062 [Lithospermum erythrorhizon]
MNSRNLIFLCFSQLVIIFILHFAYHASAQSPIVINPFKCSARIKSCSSLMYQHNQLSVEKMASFYSVNTSAIYSISYSGRQDYLINVTCSCENLNGTVAYFHDTVYKVQPNDTFFDVSNKIYSGSTWKVGGEEKSYFPGDDVTMHLLCGCVETGTQTVVTYSVQVGDNISNIATLFSAKVDDILKLNPYLGSGPEFLTVGSILYVPVYLIL